MGLAIGKLIINEYNSVNKIIVFLLISLILVIIGCAINTFVATDDIFYNYLGEQLALEKIERILEGKEKYSWISYLLIPVSLLLKIFCVFLCIISGAILIGKNINFEKLFRLLIFLECIFIFPSLIKFIWFSFFVVEFSLLEIQYFYPLSAINLFDVNNLEYWMIYPLQLFNLFELIYWIFLIYGLSNILSITYLMSLKLVASSYGLGLITWIILIMYITVSLNP